MNEISFSLQELLEDFRLHPSNLYHYVRDAHAEKRTVRVQILREFLRKARGEDTLLPDILEGAGGGQSVSPTEIEGIESDFKKFHEMLSALPRHPSVRKSRGDGGNE